MAYLQLLEDATKIMDIKPKVEMLVQIHSCVGCVCVGVCLCLLNDSRPKIQHNVHA